MTAVYVSTPSRLHFGLLRLHESADRSFGGLGTMIDRPRIELTIGPADVWEVTGPGARRAAEFGALALSALDAAHRPPALAIHIRSNVPAHRGLGSGTQLALAVAAGVRRLVGLPTGSAAELAAVVERGARSAVGSYGFLHGGLLWERGRSLPAAFSDLTSRTPLPSDWRIVVAAPPRGEGLSGSSETGAWARLPRVPAAVTRRLESLAEDVIVPAARNGDLPAFGDGVYEFGRIAGECFAAAQGGPYASPEIESLVSTVRECGVRGAGQSSWGPTVFGITESPEAAADVVDRLRSRPHFGDYELVVTAPDNLGARIELLREPNSISPAALATQARG